MARSFMAPLPLFTLESLVTLGQWSAAHAESRRKGAARRENKILDKTNMRTRRQKPARTEA